MAGLRCVPGVGCWSGCWPPWKTVAQICDSLDTKSLLPSVVGAGRWL